MIAIDTNVLVRIFARDDEAQRAAAIAVIEHAPKGERILVNPVVIAELLWTLRRAFRYSRDELAMVARQLTEHPRLQVLDRDALRDAAHLSRETGGDMIDNFIGLMNRRLGATTTFTFDHDAETAAGFTVLET